MKSQSRISAILLFLFTSIILISPGDGGEDRNSEGNTKKFEAKESFFFEEPIVNQSQFNLDGIGGDITVSGISGANSVTIAGIRRVQADSMQEVEEYLPKLQVDVQALENEIRVKTIKPLDTFERIYNVDYMIILPDDLKIKIDNLGGVITVDSITNNVIVNNRAGKVTLANILGSASIDSLTGPIESEVSLPLNGNIDLKTLTGDINLYIPLDTSAEFSARVFEFNGSIRVSNLVLQNEVRTSTSLDGTFGRGEGTIALETEVGGDINVIGLVEDLWFFQVGWNLFSSHLSNLDNDTLKSVLTIANSPLWAWHKNRFVVDNTILPGIGYWVQTQIPKLVMPVGTSPNNTEPVLNDLIRGWNLVGIKGDTFTEASAIPGINSNSIIWTWDRSHQKLISIDDQSFSPAKRGRLFPGRGYWIFKHGE